MDITCICLTHGRPYLLEEAIESFRRQFTNHYTAELLILNDCPEQNLICGLPTVRIIQYPEQFPICCEKYNAAIREARGDWLVFWDDDDISLPHRLMWLMSAAQSTPDPVLVRPLKLWNMAHGKINGYGNAKLCHGMVRRDAVLRVGCGNPTEFIDQSLPAKLKNQGPFVELTPTPSEISYIYRWDGIPFHDSFLWNQPPIERARKFHQVAISDPSFKPGTIRLNPHWNQDYPALATQAASSPLATKHI